jgi:hypothetical protein
MGDISEKEKELADSAVAPAYASPTTTGASSLTQGLTPASGSRVWRRSGKGVALLQGPAELGRCGLAGHGGGSSPTVSGRSEEMPDGFADRRTAAA